MSRTLQLTEQLISLPSVTPEDAGCLELLADALTPMGFTCERLDSGPADFRVQNLWAKRYPAQNQSAQDAISSDRPVLVFAGHTDVVPPGPLKEWTSPPFVPMHRDGKLYGRGASDMKTSIAAFVVALEEFLQTTPEPAFDIALLLTSDEEGPSIDGTKVVVEELRQRGERLDWCIVGEPTSVKQTGDMIKNGRRGTMSGKLTVNGVQGHIAYPQLARNPIHEALPALAELAATVWDRGNAFFPPTSWQISNIHGGTGASNVIPGHVVIDFNFRFCTESSSDSLQKRVHEVLDRHGVEYSLVWTVGGQPFLTTPGTLVQAVQAAIKDETGLDTELSTTGGTSDGRFIAQICPQVIEMGPPNASIHKIDEHIAVADIEPLKNIYRKTLEQLQRQQTAPQTA
ncbi:succinyl-diaminopimelate desuccinylase [Comamonas testosteroni]|uniref:Succinyl-diaminopimelate desuccinylase n=1 Tax=Comamonas testosteroni TaxID=285 RepID=A0A096FMZ5_COMTE|nr:MULTISPECIES: succinyl-diaminopimelate desuccinylase [Comamonas]KGH31138.1 succinyl-diaminopimelate desuccinylase [Comamonas testosteroni]KOC28347.1 succinyl-diaminopimelate desuccinylase [Comamonas testosteroni]KWT68687.1 N-succinyl-L,L-diaminopimelate desuccinylase [Comamonas testosteroni]MDN5505734.1 succinyl-diaminopimelate desuccinylase [Comamonas sp.]MDN5539742.1 succinyl-diaminopimelate desuccinylase [Comamonas sp.]